MKIDRLLGILSILLQNETVTAPYLAEKFEVSRRTINRDVEALCRAGIPIVTKRGSSGGISVMENYRVDRTILTESEMEEILAGLNGLKSVGDSKSYDRLMEKIKFGSSDFLKADQSILIDLSAWYSKTLKPKISTIRQAINDRRLLRFHYYSPKGESDRLIEPYFLIFKWSSWYVWGWCTSRKDFRLFKLNRMDGLEVQEESFNRREVSYPRISNEQIFPGGLKVKAVFDERCKWRLIEDFGPDSYKELKDGRLLFEADYLSKDSMINWLLSFRDKVTLLEPEEIKEEMKDLLMKMIDNLS